ncbi:MAG: CHRD domain-containing protein [Gemmatimonadales bacterium]
MSPRILGLAAGVALCAAWTSSPARDAKYTAEMTGAQETPSNNAKGTGTASFTLSGTKLQYSITVHSLTGAPTAAHIHVGATGVAGPPVYTFAIKAGSGMSGTIASGTIDLTKDASAGVSGDSLKKLLNNGNAYVNVHTRNFPNGEIRGQIMTKP